MAFEVHMTKAGIGDCINIRLGEKRIINIVVDTGDEKDNLEKCARKIKARNEKIDLLVITHDDDDHITGLEYWAEHFSKDNFSQEMKEVYMDTFADLKSNQIICNYGGKKEITMLSARKVKDIREHLLKQFDLKSCELCLAKEEDEINIIRIKIDERNEILIERLTKDTECEEEHVDLIILGPTKKAIKKYIESCDTWKEKTDLSDDEEESTNEWDYSIQQLVDKPLRNQKDSSKVNRASISFMLRYKGKTGVFCADAHPVDMVASAKKYIEYYDLEQEYIDVDFVKLPHHGSSKNINDAFIKIFRTCNYLVSTAGDADYKHPGKLTFAKIATLTDTDNINIIANYKWWDKTGDFSTKEKWKDENRCELKIDEEKTRTLSFIELEDDLLDINGIKFSI